MGTTYSTATLLEEGLGSKCPLVKEGMLGWMSLKGHDSVPQGQAAEPVSPMLFTVLKKNYSRKFHNLDMKLS